MIDRVTGGLRADGPALDAPTEPGSAPSRIHVDDQEDVLYWSRVLRVEPGDVMVAVRHVGSDVSAVARYLFGSSSVGAVASRPDRDANEAR